jgi:uncharacterized membrane protein YcaP (DUF421 family)
MESINWTEIWSNMMDLGIPWMEKILRPILVYGFLVIGLRLAGKRELAQLNSLDLVVLLTLSNTVQNAIIGNDNTWVGGILGAATLLLINHLFIRCLFGHRKLERLVEGSPVDLIKHGKVHHKALAHELITLPELTIAAHRQGFASLTEVDCARLEPGGVISFTGKDKHPELSRHQELLAQLERLTAELAGVRSSLAAKPQ